jgi:hypothetical protein
MVGPLGLKKGAEVRDVAPVMGTVLPSVSSAFDRYGAGVPTITSGTDPDPSRKPSTLHGAGFSLDFRGKHIDPEVGRNIARELNARLGGKGFQFVFETFDDRNRNHLHVELDTPEARAAAQAMAPAKAEAALMGGM